METPPQFSPPPGPVPLSQADERMWAMFAHLSALGGFVVPFGNVIGPVVVRQIFKERWVFVDTHGKEAVNVQLIKANKGAYSSYPYRYRFIK